MIAQARAVLHQQARRRTQPAPGRHRDRSGTM